MRLNTESLIFKIKLIIWSDLNYVNKKYDLFTVDITYAKKCIIPYIKNRVLTDCLFVLLIIILCFHN